MNNLAENNTPIKKIYKDKAIWIGSFVGGPLIAGYFIAENFKALNEPENAKATWKYTIPLIIFIFSLALLLAKFENFPALVIPLAYTTAAYLFSKYYQGHGIHAHLEAGGEEFGWGRIIGISLLGLIMTFVMMFLFLLIISGLGILPTK